MAKFNEILAGRFNRALQKLLSMKGGPPAAQLATEITTNIQFNQMGNDFRYLEGWDIFGNQGTFPASVGNTFGYRLRNPSASNVIAVVEKIYFNASLGTDIIMRVSTAIGQPGVELANVASGAVLDLRSQRVPGSTIIPSNANPSVAFGAPFFRWGLQPNVGVDGIVDDDQELLILPGTAIQFETSVVNVQVQFAARWRERFLEDSERA
jgi:hypothetical protein